MSLRAQLTWKGHRREDQWKVMDRVGMRSASPSLADISSSSVTKLIDNCRGDTKESSCVWSARICQLDSWICIQSGLMIDQGPLKIRASLLGVSVIRTCFTSSDVTLQFTMHIQIHSLWFDLHDKSLSSSKNTSSSTCQVKRTLSLFKCVFFAVCHLLLEIFLFSCYVLLMHHELLSKCLIKLKMYSVLPTLHKRTIIHLDCPCSLFDIFFYCTYDSMFFVFFCSLFYVLWLSTAYYLNLTFHNM